MEIKKPEPETSPVHEAPRRTPAGWIWNRESLKICLFYLVFGILWIIFSDNILLSLAKRQEDFILISSVKGVLFIMVTTFLLFLLIRHFTRELLESGEKFRLLAENMVDLVAIFDAKAGSCMHPRRMKRSSGTPRPSCLAGAARNSCTLLTMMQQSAKLTV